MPNPELDARKEIDRQLEAAGWVVQDYKSIALGVKSAGIAVREYPLATGRVDYLLYANGRVIGTVEAKPVGHTLTGVEIQSDKYVGALHRDIPAWRNPIPFAYGSTGVETQLTNGLDTEPRSRQVFTFHRPEELLRLVGQGGVKVRDGLGVGLVEIGGLFSDATRAAASRARSVAAEFRVDIGGLDVTTFDAAVEVDEA